MSDEGGDYLEEQPQRRNPGVQLCVVLCGVILGPICVGFTQNILFAASVWFTQNILFQSVLGMLISVGLYEGWVHTGTQVSNFSFESSLIDLLCCSIGSVVLVLVTCALSTKNRVPGPAWFRSSTHSTVAKMITAFLMFGVLVLSFAKAVRVLSALFCFVSVDVLFHRQCFLIRRLVH